MQFLRSIWKILHLTEYTYFYTGTARGARDNYEVWLHKDSSFNNYFEKTHVLKGINKIYTKMSIHCNALAMMIPLQRRS